MHAREQEAQGGRAIFILKSLSAGIEAHRPIVPSGQLLGMALQALLPEKA